MGQRANLVIVQHQDWRLYYDHWCANRLDTEMFWGPDLAAEFIEQREPLSDGDQWLDEVWCEGAAVLDEDRKVLVWYGGEDIMYDILYRRAFLELMKCQWQGWEIRWAVGGIVEVGAYLGLPASNFLVDRNPEAGYQVLAEYPEENNTLVTVRQQGRCLAARVYGNAEALELGPSQLGMLLAAERETSLLWNGEMPEGGLHIDMDAQSLYYWRADPAAGIEDRVGFSWSGWQTFWLGDRFEEHIRLAAIDIRLPQRDLADLQRSVLHSLRDNFTHLASNPARRLAPSLGTTTQINPWTDVNRSSVGFITDKLRILDSLESRLPIGTGYR
jgi:hypothetical protein